VVSSVKKIMTKSNQPMVFAKLEDASGNIEAVVFPSVLETTSTLWENDRILLVEGKLNDKDGSMKILADKVTAYAEDIDPESLGEVSQEEPRRAGRGNGSWQNGGSNGYGNRNSGGYRSAPAAAPTSMNNRHSEGVPEGTHDESRPNYNAPTPSMLTLKLNGNTNKSLLLELKNIVSGYAGDVPVTLSVIQEGGEKKYRLKQGVDASSPLLRHQLERILGPGAVELA